jgi:hypothetical protein
MTIVQKPLPAKLVHHTGTMIRFSRSQFPDLPPGERNCVIQLPDGRSVQGKFGPNRELPNVTGRELVRWIKSWVLWNDPVDVVVHPVGTQDKVRVEVTGPKASIPKAEVESLARRAKRLADLPASRRRKEYERWERDPTLRKAVLEAWGTSCQVKGCKVQAAVLPASARERLIDVHHLNSVSSGGSDSPINLAVLCLMHHGAMHRADDVRLLSTDRLTASVRIGGETLLIKRDVVVLLGAVS